MNKIHEKCLFLYGFFMPMIILFIKGTSLLYIFSAGLIVIELLYNQMRFSFGIIRRDNTFLLFFCVSVLSTVSAVLYNTPIQWKWQAFVYLVYSAVLVFVYILLEGKATEKLTKIICGLKISLLANVLYGYVQLLFGKTLGIDINYLLFTKYLGTVQNASHYHYGELVPTGFAWHPGAFAPIIVLAYCMFYNNIIVKILIIVIAFLTKSSTCTIGVVISVILEGCFRIKHLSPTVRKRTLTVSGIILAVAIVLIIQPKMIKIAFSEIQRLIERVQKANSGTAIDMSTYYHARYYTGFGDIISHANIVQLLFGVGGGCSGYAFVKVFQQYINMAPWDVESQLVADIISYGFFGFVLLSLWQFKMFRKGAKIDNRYIIFFLSFLSMSFTYNVRFSWMLVVLLLMNIFISRGINIWEIQGQKRNTLKWTVTHDSINECESDNCLRG